MREIVEAGPIRAWLEERIEAQDHTIVAARCGVHPRAVYRVLHEEDKLTVEKADRWLTTYNDGTRLVDLWPDLNDEGARADVDSRGRDLTKKRGIPAKLTDDQLQAVYLLHMNAGLSLRELARQGWNTWGYSSEKSALNALSSNLRRMGLEPRNRIEATVKASTVHGLASRKAKRDYTPEYAEHRNALRRQSQRCRGVRGHYPRKGAQCEHFALIGGDFCLQHDPSRREEVLATVAAARAKLGLDIHDGFLAA